MYIVTIGLNPDVSPITVNGVKYQGVILGIDVGVPELEKKKVFPTSDGPEYPNGKKKYIIFVDDNQKPINSLDSKQISIWFQTNPI